MHSPTRRCVVPLSATDTGPDGASPAGARCAGTPGFAPESSGPDCPPDRTLGPRPSSRPPGSSRGSRRWADGPGSRARSGAIRSEPCCSRPGPALRGAARLQPQPAGGRARRAPVRPPGGTSVGAARASLRCLGHPWAHSAGSGLLRTSARRLLGWRAAGPWPGSVRPRHLVSPTPRPLPRGGSGPPRERGGGRRGGCRRRGARGTGHAPAPRPRRAAKVGMDASSGVEQRHGTTSHAAETALLR